MNPLDDAPDDDDSSERPEKLIGGDDEPARSSSALVRLLLVRRSERREPVELRIGGGGADLRRLEGGTEEVRHQCILRSKARFEGECGRPLLGCGGAAAAQGSL